MNLESKKNDCADEFPSEESCACEQSARPCCGGEANRENCCSTKIKQRSEEEFRSLINRLNRIEGQIRGIRNMVERGAYCPDILIQASAVTAAVNAFNKELLANHIRSCVIHDIRDGKDEVVDELVATLQKLMK